MIPDFVNTIIIDSWLTYTKHEVKSDFFTSVGWTCSADETAYCPHYVEDELRRALLRGKEVYAK